MTNCHLQPLESATRIVIKLGTQVIRSEAGGPDLPFLSHVMEQVAELIRRDCHVMLVCSGAVGAGSAALDLAHRPKSVEWLQAAAAVGQPHLMHHLHLAAGQHGFQVAQILLTRGDFDERDRFLNLRNCLLALDTAGVVPVLNENDSVATDEIRFGDNDLLAALTAGAIDADALVLLTTADGLLDENGDVIDVLENPSDGLKHVQSGKTEWGSGGFGTKLEAAQLAQDSGVHTVIANGRSDNIVVDLLSASGTGTFVPAQKRPRLRNNWISRLGRAQGAVIIDAGAVTALRKNGSSLLPKGVRAVEGNFDRGDLIEIKDEKGVAVAKGLADHGSETVSQIRGKHSDEIVELCGTLADRTVVHRNNLVLA